MAALAQYRRQPPPNPGLSEADFRLTCASGFGDGHNSYAHCMAWFEGHLYVGTTRSLWVMNHFHPPLPNLKPWPVEVPADLYDLDRRAEIWRYDPRTDHWQRVYQAPWVLGRNQRQVPRYIGFRGMTVFQGRHDRKPCLYISTWAPQMAPEPPDILKTDDGLSFGPIPRPPWDAGVRSFRTLQPFNGVVHTSPTGARSNAQKAQECVGSDATVYASDDLDSGQWWPASPEGFGDADNLTVFEMARFNGQLYAGTVNAQGFELWRTEDASVRPYRWKRVLTRGGWRGAYNQVAVSLCEFQGALYVGTGIVNGGFHRLLKIGPAAAEILRVFPDDSWELVMGDARVTPEGYKVPLSGYASGFDKLFNGYVWRMEVHQGWLYAGTFCWAQMLPYLPRQFWPADVLHQVQRWGEDRLAYGLGGFELWRSADGIRWHNITRNGFGNCYNWGARNLVSTPNGLMVGTANPFGPTLAMRRGEHWAYEYNPRGGCEIFRGDLA